MLKPEAYSDVFQSITNKMQGYTVVYFCKLLYMFRVDPPPIIRSTTLYLHVEQFTEINNCVTLHFVGNTLEYIYDIRTPEC